LVLKAAVFVLVLQQPSIDPQTVIEYVIEVKVGAPVRWLSCCRHVVSLLDADRQAQRPAHAERGVVSRTTACRVACLLQRFCSADMLPLLGDVELSAKEFKRPLIS
jgi:hypothetical protein